LADSAGKRLSGSMHKGRRRLTRRLWSCPPLARSLILKRQSYRQTELRLDGSGIQMPCAGVPRQVGTPRDLPDRQLFPRNDMRRTMFKSPMRITPLPPSRSAPAKEPHGSVPI
jgi:hypothetical protein